MNIRALQSHERDLYRRAYEWTAQAPDWLKQLDSVFGEQSFDAYYARSQDEKQIDFGIFDDEEMRGLITVIERLPRIFEVELSAERGTQIDMLASAAIVLREELFERGAMELYVWVSSKNRPTLKLCEQIGFKADGVRQYKGQCRGRVITWVRLSMGRCNLEQGREDDNHADATAGQYIQADHAAEHGGHRCAA